jgi:hypothetical protein
MEKNGKGPLGYLIFEPKQWIAGLYNYGIINFLEIPHFGRGKDVNACMKKLLVRFHRGFLDGQTRPN